MPSCILPTSESSKAYSALLTICAEYAIIERRMRMVERGQRAGIDYSLGKSNINKKTGIHFGVIPVYSVKTRKLVAPKGSK